MLDEAQQRLYLEGVRERARHADDNPNPLIPPSRARRGRWSPSGRHLHLLQTILWPVETQGRSDDAAWPVWSFVVRTLRDKGFSAEEIYEELPAPIYNGARHGYGLVWRANPGSSELPQPGEKVGLTVAGLHAADPLGQAGNLIRLAASYAADEDALPNDPNEAATARVPFNDRARRYLSRGYRRAGVVSMTIPAAAELLMHEYPSLVSESSRRQTYEVQIGLDRFGWLRGLDNARAYLDALWAKYGALNAGRQDIWSRAGGDGVDKNETDSQKQQPVEAGSAKMSLMDSTSTDAPPSPRSVFLVHGRNVAAKTAISDLLQAMDLQVVSWDSAVRRAQQGGQGTPDTLTIVRAGMELAHGVVVLFTPDDLARLHPQFVGTHDGTHETSVTGQARQNVILEAGMALARNPERVILVSVGRVREISDISGLNFVRLNDDIAARRSFASRLEGVGFAVDRNSDDRWRTAGQFSAALALSESPPFDLPSGPSQREAPEGQSKLLTSELDSICASAVAQGWRVKTQSNTTLRIENPHRQRFTFTIGEPTASRRQLRTFAGKLRSNGLRVNHRVRRPVEDAPIPY